MEFNQLGICTPILNVLKKQGYENPTPIQEQTIPSALKGKDILGLAQTGTGKTAAFAVPTLQLLEEHTKQGTKRKIRSLVLTPTRELATQIHESFKVYGSDLSLKTSVIFGGVNQNSQVRELKAGIDILIATPGRLMDLVKQGHISLASLEIFILDEADRMLDMGFIHDIKKIMKLLPAKKQTMLFSATMPKEITGIVDTLLVDPVKVSVAPVSSTVDRISQYVYYVDQKHKIDLLIEFFEKNPNEAVLIFTQTKHGANRVVKDLGKRNITAQAIHGNKSQTARQKALDNFKQVRIQALVATDIASRGIDINELKYVVNYDIPKMPETYVHRIGRTGRAGNEGEAISFCNYQEIGLLKNIEKLIKKKIAVLENDEYPLIDKSEKPKKTQQRSSSSRRRKVNTKDTVETKEKQQKKPSGDDQAKSKKTSKPNPKNQNSKYKKQDSRSQAMKNRRSSGRNR